MTEKGNYKTVDRYTVMDSKLDDEDVDFGQACLFEIITKIIQIIK